MRYPDQVWWRSPVIHRRAWQWEDKNHSIHHGQWWQNAVIYQIAPWSYLDTSGNGKGDLNGILKKLNYIASLGVDAIWLTPIYESPMDDLGYDITDMRKVDPMFGTMQDFKRLLNVAHCLRLKVVIDQVWNHTSDQHPWFVESRSSRDNPKADWYVWADPQPDGSPPTNWLSSFTGETAWKWDQQRQQYYLFNFLESQPDLNWHNPDVVEAVLKRAEFWLDLGVDGMRIDAVNFFLHDAQMRDNPIRTEEHSMPDGVPEDNPLTRQILQYGFNRPETLESLKPLREMVNRYPGVMTLGEVTLCEDSIRLAGEYTEGADRLHMAYHSGLLVDKPLTASLVANMLEKVMESFSDGGMCWIVGNHDYGRLRSRWTGHDPEGNPYPDEFYHMVAALLLCLPGAFCLYQGDELGLEEAAIPEDIPPEEIKDPFGKALYPDVKGRDGSRTPMPWNSEEPHAGFSTAEPWLPVPDAHFEVAINQQHIDPDSLLNTWRQLMHWRKNQPALEAGKLELVDSPEPILAFVRAYAEQELLCVFNISGETARFDLTPYPDYFPFADLRFSSEFTEESVRLPPYGAFFANINPQRNIIDVDA